MNMRFFPLLLTVLLFHSWGFTQDEQTVFWQVVSPNKKDTSYLFGTIHMLPKDQFILPEEVKKALLSSDRSYFELDLNVPQEEIMAASKLPEGESLFDYVNQAQKDSLFAYGEAKMGIDSVMFSYAFSPFKPFIFAQLPLMEHIQQSIAVDFILQNLAKENSIPVYALETHLQQIGVFDNMPAKLKTETLMEVVRQTTNQDQELAKLQDNYLSQNTTYFLEDMKEDTEMNRYLHQYLLKERNENWTKRLQKELKGNKSFVAVGAAHLVGPDGLVSLLRAEKFTVEPLRIQLKP